MAHYYYSAQPLLAWCLNHYFYRRRHFVWVAAPFYPHRLNNPASSNPLKLYRELYEPWKEHDPYSKTLQQWRIDLQKGVNANAGQLGADRASRLKRICSKIDVQLFYPVVFRVDISLLDPQRLRDDAGSAADVGSQEFRIEALEESEFDVLFADFETETDLDADARRLYSGSLTDQQALSLLEAKCDD